MALKAHAELGVFHACLVAVVLSSIAGRPGGLGVWGMRKLNSATNVSVGDGSSSSTSSAVSHSRRSYEFSTETDEAAMAAADTPELRFPALVVFGDSTVDSGNNNFLPTVVRANFEPYSKNFRGGVPTGRFTDGLISADFLSQKLGIPSPLPYLSPDAHGEVILTGVNFASSGSGWFEGTAKLFNVRGIATQVAWFQNWAAEVLRIAGPKTRDFIVKNALYFVSSGTNDWANDYFINPPFQQQYTTNQYRDLILGLVRENLQKLYSSGGRNFIILSLPPLDCIPEQITVQGLGSQGCVEFLNDIAVDFNSQLSSLLRGTEKTMAGSRLVLVDSYQPIYDAFHNPQKYGFKYACTGCCGTGKLEFSVLCNKYVPTCSNPDDHLFWDSFHPTSHFYSVLIDQMYDFIKPIFLAPPHALRNSSGIDDVPSN